MRLWTLHPKYLDPQGLVALWREGLLARAVLRGETRGYKHHPQLQRFPSVSAVNAYLAAVLAEARARTYSFDASKVGPTRKIRLPATTGQLEYEWDHLMRKLRKRNPTLHRRWRTVEMPEAHPLFSIKSGGIEAWERT
jgi:hypothetical protein